MGFYEISAMFLRVFDLMGFNEISAMFLRVFEFPFLSFSLATLTTGDSAKTPKMN